MFGVSEGDQQTVGDKLDILAHERLIHADKLDWESDRQELLFNLYCLLDDGEYSIWVRTALEVREQEASEIRVKAFVSADEFVGKRQAWHETTLLEPKDGCKRAGKEDALDGGECDYSLSKGGFLVGNPRQCPVGLALDARHSLDGIEETRPLGSLANVRVDEERVDFGVDVFTAEEVQSAALYTDADGRVFRWRWKSIEHARRHQRASSSDEDAGGGAHTAYGSHSQHPLTS